MELRLGPVPSLFVNRLGTGPKFQVVVEEISIISGGAAAAKAQAGQDKPHSIIEIAFLGVIWSLLMTISTVVLRRTSFIVENSSPWDHFYSIPT